MTIRAMSCALSLTLAQLAGGHLMAAEPAADNAAELREQQQLNRRIQGEVSRVGSDVAALHQLMRHSGVVDPGAMKQVDGVLGSMREASDGAMKDVVRSLAKAYEERNEIRTARESQGAAVSRLEEAKKQAALKAERARMLDRTRQITEDLEKLKEETLEQANKELAGEEVDPELQQQLADEQAKIGDQLEQLEESLATMEEPPASMPEADEMAHDIAQDIEDGELLSATQDQQELLDQLQGMADQLDPTSADQQDAMDQMPMDSEMAQAMQEMAEQLAQQAQDIEDFSDTYDGSELAENMDYNELQAQQMDMAAQMEAMSEQMDMPPSSMEMAMEQMASAQEALTEGEFEEAMQANEMAQQQMQQAMQEMAQQQQQMAQNQQQQMQQQQQMPMQQPPQQESQTEQEDQPLLMGNQLAKNGAQGGDAWQNSVSERDRRAMMQGQQEPAPPAYAERADAYFQALAGASNR